MTSKNTVIKHLKSHAERLFLTRITELFDRSSDRFDRLSFELDGLFVDFSKNNIDQETLSELFDLARLSDVEGWRRAMFAGDIINASENRPALHVALRDPNGEALIVDGVDIRAAVRDTLNHMEQLVEKLRSASWLGATGKLITDIVHIGIGGSVLGPEIAVRALASKTSNAPKIHFVANVDAEALMPTLSALDAETTLVVIVSKTFTTLDTMTNAVSARQWLSDALPGKDISAHMIGITAARDVAMEFGVTPENILTFWDWVGGRFSLWSAVGFPVAVTAGMDAFRQLLEGARKLDEHFLNAPFESNIPVLLALVGIWNANYLDMRTHAVLPYDERLAGFPPYLQQLEMESTGKGVHVDGSPVINETAPIIFGYPGTDAQHTFFQALHQGTRSISMDFIGCLKGEQGKNNHHDQLMASLFSQTEALMLGRLQSQAGVSADQACPGNRSSTTILLDALTPETLGMLLALYEHKIFVQSIIWNINAFDQWGVELGKQLGKTVLQEIDAAQSVNGHDGSTNGLINRYLNKR
ncbi:MAG: glucose-6-phosphate isomerase [Rhodospirillales bacterium]|nr:glucose-6-phosphate isomerase [Rhodospirillales bacterium]